MADSRKLIMQLSNLEKKIAGITSSTSSSIDISSGSDISNFFYHHIKYQKKLIKRNVVNDNSMSFSDKTRKNEEYVKMKFEFFKKEQQLIKTLKLATKFYCFTVWQKELGKRILKRFANGEKRQQRNINKRLHKKKKLTPAQKANKLLANIPSFERIDKYPSFSDTSSNKIHSEKHEMDLALPETKETTILKKSKQKGARVTFASDIVSEGNHDIKNPFIVFVEPEEDSESKSDQFIEIPSENEITSDKDKDQQEKSSNKNLPKLVYGPIIFFSTNSDITTNEFTQGRTIDDQEEVKKRKVFSKKQIAKANSSVNLAASASDMFGQLFSQAKEILSADATNDSAIEIRQIESPLEIPKAPLLEHQPLGLSESDSDSQPLTKNVRKPTLSAQPSLVMKSKTKNLSPKKSTLSMPNVSSLKPPSRNLSFDNEMNKDDYVYSDDKTDNQDDSQSIEKEKNGQTEIKISTSEERLTDMEEDEKEDSVNQSVGLDASYGAETFLAGYNQYLDHRDQSASIAPFLSDSSDDDEEEMGNRIDALLKDIKRKFENMLNEDNLNDSNEKEYQRLIRGQARPLAVGVTHS